MTSMYYKAARELSTEASIIPESYSEYAHYVVDNDPIVLQQDKDQFKKEIDHLWDGIYPFMQEPFISEGTAFSAYSGHRIVQFDDTPYALGFHLLQLDIDKRYIQAERRLVYSDMPRLPYYIAETIATEIDPEIKTPINERRRKLGVIAGWVDLFTHAEPYDKS